jgi:hypothetical protein
MVCFGRFAPAARKRKARRMLAGRSRSGDRLRISFSTSRKDRYEISLYAERERENEGLRT